MKGKNGRSQLLRRLSKSWVLQRLKHIDLSVVPSWLGPCVSTASRYQHSLGVGRLSLLISDGTEHDQFLLTAAGVLHDVGNGPFPHISDHLMKDMLGFKHEGAVSFAFEKSPLKDSSILEEYGIDLEEVASVVKGEHRLSPLLNGHPDLDNADNIYRFMNTIPGKPLGEASYQPSEIAVSMSVETGGMEIPHNLRRRWLRDWEKVYHYLWNDRLNMIGWTMLGRALRILRDDLTPTFFTMTNREAFHLIRLKLPKLAIGLKKKAFKITLDRRYNLLRGEALKLSDPTDLRKIEDELCKETGLEDWCIGLTVDRPLLREEADHWRVYLTVYEGVEEAKFLLEDILSNSVPISTS
ncbi:MAG: HD domain-containing protein [Candidatus Bathyarchaeia archaeon]